MTTAPFDPAVELLLTQTHEQTFRAVVVPPAHAPIELDVKDWSIMWDEDRSPRVDLTLVCPLTEDLLGILDLLDARTIVRVQVTVGYRLPSGVYDEHQVADLHLRSRGVERPDGMVELLAVSDEMLLIDAAPATPFYEGVLLHDSCVAFITQTVEQLTDGTPLDPAPLVVTTGPGPEFTYDAFPVDWWNGIVDAADALNASFYDNGDRVFRLAPRQQLASTTSLILTHGANGTIVESSAKLDRDQWWNAATILWVWSNRANPSLPDRTWGTVYVDSGPFAPATAGRREYTEQRQGQVSAAVAQRITATVMRRLLAKSRTYKITAVSAWWLRPEDTVTITLPTGGTERHLVATVAHEPGGKMTVTTRLPDDQTLITGE